MLHLTRPLRSLSGRRLLYTTASRQCPIPKSFKSQIPNRLDAQPDPNVSRQTPLGELLSKVIKVTGPLTVSMYMRQCLTHPEHGYYTSRDPLGARGDFITSPEISQMFGEMIGVWFFALWLVQGKPASVNFVEFGPGKGTLMFDAMRSFGRLLNKREDPAKVKLNIVFVEASHVLRQRQAALLGDSGVDATGEFWKAKHRWGGDLLWVDTEKDVFEITHESDTNFIIAHEFFDALPINKFVKVDDGTWREIHVDQHPDTGELCLVRTPHETPMCSIVKTNPRYSTVPAGTVVEVSPDTAMYTATISQLITRNEKSTGGALIVDYGPKMGVPSNTLRGIKDHKIVNPFHDPGEVDLSADVDFQAVAQAAIDAADVSVVGPVDQGDFLEQVGMGTRLKQLEKHVKTENEREILMTGYKRLVEKNGASMGKIYKFMGIVPKRVEVPIGFDPLTKNDY